jgi:hypothetical protein
MIIAQALKNKVAESQFDNLSDWEVAAILNAPDPTLPKAKQVVSNRVLIAYLITVQAWGEISLRITDPESATNPRQVKRICKMAVDALTIAENTDARNPGTHQLIQDFASTLVDAGIVTQGIADGFISQLEADQSWAQSQGLSVDSRLVGLARGGV